MSGKIITVDVGGILVKTNRTTLEQLTYFQKLFEGDFKKTEIFLDVDYEIFRHVLNRIRLANYVYPQDQEDNINAMYRYLMSEPEPVTKIPEFRMLRESSNVFSNYNQNTSVYGTPPGNSIFVNIIMKFHTFSRLEILFTYLNSRIVINETELHNYFKPIGEEKRMAFFKMRNFMVNLINEQMNKQNRINFTVVGENATLDCLVKDIQ